VNTPWRIIVTSRDQGSYDMAQADGDDRSVDLQRMEKLFLSLA
jgi:hypothetical protein